MEFISVSEMTRLTNQSLLEYAELDLGLYEAFNKALINESLILAEATTIEGGRKGKIKRNVKELVDRIVKWAEEALISIKKFLETVWKKFKEGTKKIAQAVKNKVAAAGNSFNKEEVTLDYGDKAYKELVKRVDAVVNIDSNNYEEVKEMVDQGIDEYKEENKTTVREAQKFLSNIMKVESKIEKLIKKTTKDINTIKAQANKLKKDDPTTDLSDLQEAIDLNRVRQHSFRTLTTETYNLIVDLGSAIIKAGGRNTTGRDTDQYANVSIR